MTWVYSSEIFFLLCLKQNCCLHFMLVQLNSSTFFLQGMVGLYQGFSGFFWACVSAGMYELEEVYALFLILWGREIWGQGQGFHVYSEFLP